MRKRMDMRSEERDFAPDEWKRIEEIWKGSTTKTLGECISEMENEKNQ